MDDDETEAEAAAAERASLAPLVGFAIAAAAGIGIWGLVALLGWLAWRWLRGG